MCNCKDYKKCSKCGRYTCDSTIGYRDKPTVTAIKCIFGGRKKWVWKHTKNGIELVFITEGEELKYVRSRLQKM